MTLRNLYFVTCIGLVSFLGACSSKKNDSATTNDKQTQLEQLKSNQSKNQALIDQLEKEIKAGTPGENSGVAKLVGVDTLSPQTYKHYVDLQGKVSTSGISYIAPRGMGGQVKAIYVHEGQPINKGQLVLKLDDAIYRQQIVAAQQQTQSLVTQLSYAKNLYQRQKNLWDQGIGTEVQLLTSKTNVETLESQLKAANENINTLREQLKTTSVYSDVSGVVDKINVRVGELFTGMSALGPQISVVNTSNYKAETSVPENYSATIKVGAPVEVTVDDIDKAYPSTISRTGVAVDNNYRGFYAEAKLPVDKNLKPNQSAKMKILDYSVSNAIVIPVNTIQTDNTGKFVFLAVTSSKGITTAKKQTVNVGSVYANEAEIATGLQAGDKLVTQGYQSLFDGALITTQSK